MIRRPRPPATVRVRLTVLAVLLVGAGMTAGGLLVVGQVRHRLTQGAENEARLRASDTAALLGLGDLPASLPAAGEDQAVVQVVDEQGQVIAASAELRGRAPLLPGLGTTGTAAASLRRPLAGDDADYQVVAVPGTTRAGDRVTVVAARSLEPAQEGVQAAAVALLAVVPVLLLVVAGTAWLLVGRALRPVEAIRAQAAGITAADLGRRVPEPAVLDEVGRLARTVNAMLAGIQETHDRQRRFVGDASHELRSPLATMRTQLEVALAHPDDTDWVALARGVHTEGVRLEHLVEELLVLSRSDSAAAPAEAETVDLDELVLAAAADVRDRGRVGLDLAGVSAVRLRGRAGELRRVVRNLLDNAERHAAGQVRVALSAGAGYAELVVADDGAGIPPPGRDRVFDRFVRLDAARDRDSGGTGLGLAIVAAIVTGHGGRVWVGDSAEGAEFHVRLPLAGPGRSGSVAGPSPGDGGHQPEQDGHDHHDRQ